MDPTTDTALRCLITSGFSCTPWFASDGELDALIFCRWWTTNHVDVVRVHDEDHAEAYRVAGLDPLHPHDVAAARVVWRDLGTVAEMTAALRELPELRGFPLALRTPRAQSAVESAALQGMR